MRIDVYLVEKGFCESRNRASRLIDEGKVLLDGKTVSKPSFDVDDGDHTVEITLRDRFVGRGGLKLEAALEQFKIDVEGFRCIDVGASTGGFTDCLLQRGASHVCAVDSGRGQLHQSLVQDIRVTNLEGFNAKELDRESFGTFDIAVTDVSFISQTLLHGPIASVLKDGAIFISLIKPQFEAGRSALSKNGIVKKPIDRERSIVRVLESAEICGFEAIGIIPSPILGGDGNREFLAAFIKKRCERSVDMALIKRICKD